MYFIDTHSHLFDEAFDTDRAEAVTRALELGVKKIILPAIDSSSYRAMVELQHGYPENFFLLAGLHPTSVNEIEDWQSEVAVVEQMIRNNEHKFVGIGEVGLDLYWDKEHIDAQRSALSIRC